MPASPRAIAATFPLRYFLRHDVLMLFSSGYDPGKGGFGQQPGFGAGGGANPYSNPPGVGAPPPRKSNSWLWILGIVGVLGIGMLVCCGGVTWWGFNAGVGMMAQMLKDEVAGHPVIQEHLGEVSGNPSMNLMESTKETEKRGTGDNILVFDVKGTNGNEGKLIAQQSKQPQPGNMFSKIDLRLPSGEEISIK